MTSLRQIIGLLALALASVGPLPLWMHHAVCHTHSRCLTHSSDCGHAADSGTHAAVEENRCGHSHSAATVIPQRSRGSSASPELAQLEHDCFVCYQLSQAAAASALVSAKVAKLPPITSVVTQRTCVTADLNGLYAPRGPPAV